MTDAIRELKIRAQILHKKIGPANTRRRECLNTVAAQWGFSSYSHAKATLTGADDASEFGTLLYSRNGPTLNAWYSDYNEAKRDRAAANAFLLAYKTHFLVVGPEYIASLGLDPDDADWTAIGRDWVKPASVPARTRLYGKLVARLERI
jgi:hypothetical protein